MDANTKEDNPRRRPSSQMSFKSDETNRASPALEKRTKVDLTSPLLRVPMSLGWKRELVYRSKLDHKSKRMGKFKNTYLFIIKYIHFLNIFR